MSTLEFILIKQIEKPSSRIEDFESSNEVLSIGVACSAMTMDIVTEYATGNSNGNMNYKDFNQGLVHCFAGFGRVWRFADYMPWLVSLFMMLPSWMMIILSETTD